MGLGLGPTLLTDPVDKGKSVQTPHLPYKPYWDDEKLLQVDDTSQLLIFSYKYRNITDCEYNYRILLL
jgi:hypothetical protein